MPLPCECLGPRTEVEGFDGTICLTTNQPKRWRMAVSKRADGYQQVSSCPGWKNLIRINPLNDGPSVHIPSRRGTLTMGKGLDDRRTRTPRKERGQLSGPRAFPRERLGACPATLSLQPPATSLPCLQPVLSPARDGHRERTRMPIDNARLAPMQPGVSLEELKAALGRAGRSEPTGGRLLC